MLRLQSGADGRDHTGVDVLTLTARTSSSARPARPRRAGLAGAAGMAGGVESDEFARRVAEEEWFPRGKARVVRSARVVRGHAPDMSINRAGFDLRVVLAKPGLDLCCRERLGDGLSGIRHELPNRPIIDRRHTRTISHAGPARREAVMPESP